MVFLFITGRAVLNRALNIIVSLVQSDNTKPDTAPLWVLSRLKQNRRRIGFPSRQPRTLRLLNCTSSFVRFPDRSTGQAELLHGFCPCVGVFSVRGVFPCYEANTEGGSVRRRRGNVVRLISNLGNVSPGSEQLFLWLLCSRVTDVVLS